MGRRSTPTLHTALTLGGVTSLQTKPGGRKGASEPTAEDLQAAVDKLGPQPYLYDVADECEIDLDRCRTLLHEIGLYGDVIDAASRTKRAGVPRRD